MHDGMSPRPAGRWHQTLSVRRRWPMYSGYAWQALADLLADALW